MEGITKKTTEAVTDIGTVLAIVISWSLNKYILWAIIHGFFSWFYVIYYWFYFS